MKDPLEVVRELNRRRRSTRIETPLDLIRILNKERRRRATTQKLLKHLE